MRFRGSRFHNGRANSIHAIEIHKGGGCRNGEKLEWQEKDSKVKKLPDHPNDRNREFEFFRWLLNFKARNNIEITRRKRMITCCTFYIDIAILFFVNYPSQLLPISASTPWSLALASSRSLLALQFVLFRYLLFWTGLNFCPCQLRFPFWNNWWELINPFCRGRLQIWVW